MTPKNRIAKMYEKFEFLPKNVQNRLFSLAFGRTVKFFGTSGLQFEEVSTGKARIIIKNRSKVQNHIGGVHAAAMGLLVESATGAVVGMNLPDDKLPLCKSMNVNFVKRSTGDMWATATLTPEQIASMHTEDKGEVNVKVEVIDEAGVAPIEAELIWAWIPKKRK